MSRTAPSALTDTSFRARWSGPGASIARLASLPGSIVGRGRSVARTTCVDPETAQLRLEARALADRWHADLGEWRTRGVIR